jgi:hypothetical protein
MKTPQEIIENNKLIAEFMGLIRSDEPVGGLGHGKYWWFHKKPFLWDESICSDEELNYHQSWDWVMPVVEKIEREASYHVNIQPESCTIQSYGGYCNPLIVSNYSRGIKGNTKEQLIEAYGKCSDSKIEGVWTAVVEFIKWYKK